MKRFYFIFLLLIPSLLFAALDQKECENYFKAAIAEGQSAQNLIKQISDQSTEGKIHFVNSAIQYYWRANDNLNVIFNAINSTKKHKRKPWQLDLQEACKQQQQIISDSINTLQKDLVAFNIALSLEQKEKEAGKWIDLANKKDAGERKCGFFASAS